ncbi:MAG: carboxypeptidase-like regulatory domain-containing protein [Proteobacteria bacterium]|nr:carboxypeptidase-like regulatory domain-containing protein [Pseudomonadota bacterium]
MRICSTLGLPIILIFAFVAGCEALPSDTVFQKLASGEDIACSAKRGCDASRQCLAERCVGVSSASMPLVMRFTYPEALHAPVVVQGEFQPGQSFGTFLQPALVAAAIQVKYHDVPVAGVATFLSRTGSAALDYTQTVELMRDTDANAAARLNLVPGQYDVIVSPSNMANQYNYPTMVFYGIEVKPGHDMVSLDVETGAEATRFPEESYWGGRVTGIIELSGIDDSEFVGEIGLRLQEVDAPASSATFPICRDGRCTAYYELLLPPQRYDVERIYDVQVILKPTPRLTITKKLSFVSLGLSSDFQEKYYSFVLSPMAVDALAAQTITGRLHSAAGLSSGKASVAVACQSRSKDMRWFSTAHEVTDAHGHFTVDMPVLPDSDDVTCKGEVIFDQANAHGSMAAVPLQWEENSIAIEIYPKAVYSGIVTSAEGKPVRDARVTAKPVEASMGTLETTTNDKGYFSLKLDTMAYEVLFEPPARTGMPSHRQMLSRQVEPREKESIVLKRPDMIYGQCMDSSGKPISGVWVDAFWMDSLGELHQLASGQSDDDGLFRLFVVPTDSLVGM